MSAGLILVVVASLTQASTNVAKRPNAAAYERLTKLVGQWRGSLEWSGARSGKGPMDARYYLTGAGSALVEDLEVDSKIVMTSVYHMDGADLRMTHYCGAQNQPRLKATHVDDKSVHFSFVDATNLQTPDAPHVHGAEIRFRSDGEITIVFTFLAGGQESTERIDLTRAPAGDPTR